MGGDQYSLVLKLLPGSNVLPEVSGPLQDMGQLLPALGRLIFLRMVEEVIQHFLGKKGRILPFPHSKGNLPDPIVGIHRYRILSFSQYQFCRISGSL